MFHYIWGPLFLVALPFIITSCLDIGIEYATGVRPGLALNLIKTLVWTFVSNTIHVLAIDVHVYAYYYMVRSFMWYRGEFWLRVGWPVGDATVWNLQRWAAFGWVSDNGRHSWMNARGNHPVVKLLSGVAKLSQIFLEPYLLEYVFNWSGDILLPPIGLKPEYLPRSLQGQPVYNGSASLWLWQIFGRVASELLLSACLFGASAIFTVALHQRGRDPENPDEEDMPDFGVFDWYDITCRRMNAASTMFNVMSRAIIFRMAYQTTYPMYLILQPICGLLRLLPYVSARSPLGANFFPIWQLVWSALLLIPVIVVIPHVNKTLSRIWTAYFTLVYNAMCFVDHYYSDWSYYGYEFPISFMEIDGTPPTFDWYTILSRISLRDNTPVPRPYDHQGVGVAFISNENLQHHLVMDNFLQEHGFMW